MSASRTGKKLSAEHVENVRASLTGRKHTEEAKARMSVAQRSVSWSRTTRSDAMRQNLAANITGQNKHGSTPVTINGVEYPSILAASRALGVPNQTLHYRLSKGYYDDQES
uniref:hypothetical protein n=1 Tax=Caballeronia arationis TaxID=1777142 RepID=UPI000AA06B0C